MEQLSLFNVDALKDSKRPGQKTFDQWLATENPTFHGTFRDDWRDAAYAHTGTFDQAETRLRQAGRDMGAKHGGDYFRASYYGDRVPSGDFDDEMHVPEGYGDTPKDHIGRIYANRFNNPPHPKNFRDSEANAGEMGARLVDDDWTQVPKSVQDSAGSLQPWDNGEGPEWRNSDYSSFEGNIKNAKHAAYLLERGHTIRYENEAESRNDKSTDPEAGYSYISPQFQLQSWERDVLAEPSATSMAHDFAKRRIANRKEGMVPLNPDVGQEALRFNA